MNYIQKNLLSGEEIKYVAKLHFFLFVQPIILLIIGAFLASSPKEISAMTHYAGLLILFFGIVSLLSRILIKVGSSYAVTNKRVILKTGVISRRAVDLVLAKCEGLHIKQSILGRIFNFGTITVTTGGVSSSYPYIANPLDFRREINMQIG
ncbi:PH domain-containing protein [Dysgonomonas mossii]|uniref:PH domain-containing protein n=1 Tax=Dysgonomonas mossii TaxID=163665 RepID=A0A4Y9IJS4_9BACT|nr:MULTISPECIES: PH domain-containing protein [Dysgonomonas]MBD8389207.1 PH domain-containing protein [Dysgonomonas sp. BGC7]MBF0762753.1 PH domain-containing protein [Dysgonomonas mossii]TFU86289.1 PH domain-containing protein [Dysgonomonas mossii]